jgi:hypothetical protein
MRPVSGMDVYDLARLFCLVWVLMSETLTSSIALFYAAGDPVQLRSGLCARGATA